MLITQVIWASLAYVNNTGYLGRLWRMLITQVIWASLAYVNNTGYLGVSGVC